MVKQQVAVSAQAGTRPNGWRESFARASQAVVKALLALSIAAAAAGTPCWAVPVAAAPPRGAVLVALGAWAAIDRGPVCEALSRSSRAAARGQPQAVAGFTFAADGSRWAEFHARLSRPARAGSSVILKVGGQPFLLVSRGAWAWSSGPGQDQALTAALRTGGEMRIETRDLGGARLVDTYRLDGAPTAIDAAAARCALRGAGKIP